MILSDKTISDYIRRGDLCISSLKDIQIQPASIDIRIGSTFSYPRKDQIIKLPLTKEVIYVTSEYKEYYLEPGEFVLATTKEYFKLPNDVTAFVEGRSSIGRLGLFIQNAGWVDPGFEGEITLELYNSSKCPIVLTPGVRIGQLVFAKLDKVAMNPYKGKYQGQRGATGSKIHLDTAE